MAAKPKPEGFENLCGANLKNKKGRKQPYCRRPPVVGANRCSKHGGMSTGPKNSLEYYRKNLMAGAVDAGEIINPLDLTGEIAMVRGILTKMQTDPLKVKCEGCDKLVVATVGCPNDPEHSVSLITNDFRAIVNVTKVLSDILKTAKEIQQSKEVTYRVEVINVLVFKITEAFNLANSLGDPAERTSAFVGAVERLLVDPAQIPAYAGTDRPSRAPRN